MPGQTRHQVLQLVLCSSLQRCERNDDHSGQGGTVPKAIEHERDGKALHRKPAAAGQTLALFHGMDGSQKRRCKKCRQTDTLRSVSSNFDLDDLEASDRCVQSFSTHLTLSTGIHLITLLRRLQRLNLMPFAELFSTISAMSP